jgi:hydrogenase maturation protease
VDGHVLVAGVGNIFFRDDGFGPAVAVALLTGAAPLPAEGVRVVDYGIRGMHLTYDLLDGVDALVLVDAVPAGPDQAPGQIVVLRVDPADLGDLRDPSAGFDAHGMQPVAVLAGVTALGGRLPQTYVVGCVPADTSDGIGLTEPVAASVAEAARTVRDLVHALVGGTAAPDQQERKAGA